MSGKLLKSFFSSGLQAVSIQVLGVAFLGIASYVLSEEDFGIINWCNAVAMFVTTVLGFGLDQVVARRVATSKTSDWAAVAFLFHAFIMSVIAIVAVLAISSVVSKYDVAYKYLPFFFIAQCFLFLLLPLKQYLNAKHIFTPYGVIAVISNVLKLALAIILMRYGTFDIMNIAYVLTFSAIVEFIALLSFVLLKQNLQFRFRKNAYKMLVKESIPQYLSAIFDTTLSRIDWILLGIIASYAVTGGYSFAYRAYELARLPIVIIAPIILNVFAKLLVNDTRLTSDKQDLVKQIFSVQVYLAVLIPLICSILWSPILGEIFVDGKYGAKNENEFLILSVCIPIHFFINLLWTLAFSARKYKYVTTITIITASSNLILNIILIPMYNGVGAAMSYLITTCIQATLYYVLVYKHIMKIPVGTLLLFVGIAIGAYWLVNTFDIHVVIKLVGAVSIYLIVAFLTGRVKKENFLTLIALVRK